MENLPRVGRYPATESVIPSVETKRAGGVQPRIYEKHSNAVVAGHQVRGGTLRPDD